MAALYSRIQDINDKVNDLSLSMSQWRVLFAINEGTSLETIKELTDEEEASIKSAVDTLSSMKLVLVEGEDEAPAPTASNEEKITETVVAEETIEEVVEETPTIEDPVEEVVEEHIDLSESSIEDIVEEAVEESPIEEEIVGDIVEETIEVEAMEEVVEEEVVEEAVEETPAVEEKEEAPAASEATASAEGKIVVVDDSIVIRKMVELALENEAVEVIGYSSGQTTIDNFDSDQASLYIVDMAVPDLSGIEVVKKIKAKKDIPTMMFASKNSAADEDKLKAEGVNDFVPKPFRDDDLVAKIKALI